MPKTNLHTHSVYSDGKNTIEQMVQAAVEKGFLTLGMSDHSYTDFDGRYCMKKEKFDDYINEISALKNKYSGVIDIFRGLEMDYYSKEVDFSRLDYVIGSVHYVVGGGVFYDVDGSPEDCRKGIDEGFGGDPDRYAVSYYESLCRHMRENPIDIVGHLDLPTIFGMMNEDSKVYKNAALEAAEFAVERGIIVEINTGGVFKKRKTHPYPADFILKHICEKGGRIAINSDSHVTSSIDFYFEEAAEYAKNSGFKSAVMLTENGFVDIEI